MEPQLVVEMVQGLVLGMRGAQQGDTFTIHIPSNINLQDDIGGDSLETRILAIPGIKTIKRTSKKVIGITNNRVPVE